MQCNADMCFLCVFSLFRYLRGKFRAYLENNDEDHKLRFWEYAEDFKLNHPESYRFDDQVQRSRGGAAWPSDYRCSKSESRKQALFLYTAFVSDTAPCRVSTCSAEMSSAIQSQLAKAPRSLFVALQAAVMQELAELFYVDFSRSGKYRASFLAASMDKQGCREVRDDSQLRHTVSAAALIIYPSVYYIYLFNICISIY